MRSIKLFLITVSIVASSSVFAGACKTPAPDEVLRWWHLAEKDSKNLVPGTEFKWLEKHGLNYTHAGMLLDAWKYKKISRAQVQEWYDEIEKYKETDPEKYEVLQEEVFQKRKAMPTDPAKTMKTLESKIFMECKQPEPGRRGAGTCFKSDKTLQQYEADILNDELAWMAWKKDIIPKCVDYYKNQYFASVFAELSSELEQEQAQAKADAEKADQDRQKREQARVVQAKDLQISLMDLAIWGDESKLSKRKAKSYRDDPKEAFNVLNKKVVESMESFTQPPKPEVTKGEFEKTADYEKRVAAADKEYEEQVHKLIGEAPVKRRSVLNEAFIDRLGPPLVEKLQYDADKEQFDITITSTKAKYNVHGSIAIPITEAKELKAKLERALPWVVYDLKDNRISSKAVLLQPSDSEEAWVFAITGSDDPSIQLGKAQLQQYEAEKEAERQRMIAEERARRTELAKTHPYYLEIECSFGSRGNYMDIATCLRHNGTIAIRDTGQTQTYGFIDSRGRYEISTSLTKNHTVLVQNGGNALPAITTITIRDQITRQILWQTNNVGAANVTRATPPY